MALSLASVVGPWFVGIGLEMFATGAALVLSINYFVAVAGSHGRADASWRLGVVLVAVSLALCMAQMAIDMDRGWRMFGDGFDDIELFLTPNVLYFVSPLLGILCASICQAFLLRRIVLFLGSLAHLWPALAHRATRAAIAAVVGAAIIACTLAGACSSWEIWKSGSLANLSKTTSTSSRFHQAELVWLGTSVGVDVILSSMLCVELLWARRKLAIAGGRMGELVNSLILVTFHGGFVVTALQVSTMILYQMSTASSYCYMLYLPVYTITLVLSLSLPLAQAASSAPSQYSLPTIHDVDNENDVVQPSSREKHPEARKRPAWRRQLSTLTEKGFGGMSWSMAGDMMPAAPRQAHTKDGHARSPQETGAAGYDGRRPSEPNSLAPLLHGSRRPSLASSLGSPHSYRQPVSPMVFANTSPYTSTFSPADRGIIHPVTGSLRGRHRTDPAGGGTLIDGAAGLGEPTALLSSPRPLPPPSTGIRSADGHDLKTVPTSVTDVSALQHVLGVPLFRTTEPFQTSTFGDTSPSLPAVPASPSAPTSSSSPHQTATYDEPGRNSIGGARRQSGSSARHSLDLGSRRRPSASAHEPPAEREGRSLSFAEMLAGRE